MLDEPEDFKSISSLWNLDESFFTSNWDYESLLDIVEKNINLFCNHPEDVGLSNRNKHKHAFKFDF